MKVSIVITVLFFSFSSLAQGVGTYGGVPQCPMIFAKMSQAIFEKISKIDHYGEKLDLKKFQDIVKKTKVIVVEEDGHIRTDYQKRTLFISRDWCIPGVLDEMTGDVFQQYLDLYYYENR